jgi:hypothetical protein
LPVGDDSKIRTANPAQKKGLRDCCLTRLPSGLDSNPYQVATLVNPGAWCEPIGCNRLGGALEECVSVWLKAAMDSNYTGSGCKSKHFSVIL